MNETVKFAFLPVTNPINGRVIFDEILCREVNELEREERKDAEHTKNPRLKSPGTPNIDCDYP